MFRDNNKGKMMTEDHRQLRAALAAETLLTGSLQSQRSLSSLTRTIDDMPSEDLIAGARPNGSISNVRRFFCLLVTFDLFFTALVWLICTMVRNAPNIKIKFHYQNPGSNGLLMTHR